MKRLQPQLQPVELEPVGSRYTLTTPTALDDPAVVDEFRRIVHAAYGDFIRELVGRMPT